MPPHTTNPCTPATLGPSPPLPLAYSTSRTPSGNPVVHAPPVSSLISTLAHITTPQGGQQQHRLDESPAPPCAKGSPKMGAAGADAASNALLTPGELRTLVDLENFEVGPCGKYEFPSHAIDSLKCRFANSKEKDRFVVYLNARLLTLHGRRYGLSGTPAFKKGPHARQKKIAARCFRNGWPTTPKGVGIRDEYTRKVGCNSHWSLHPDGALTFNLLHCRDCEPMSVADVGKSSRCFSQYLKGSHPDLEEQLIVAAAKSWRRSGSDIRPRQVKASVKETMLDAGISQPTDAYLTYIVREGRKRSVPSTTPGVH